jgi:outer membrane protein OmpA-like peptidoglycan-associated protein
MDPTAWWHQLEGGRIAEQRPPPPNVNAPYPNFAGIPDRPVVTDPAQRRKIASGLVADNVNAKYGAGLAPLATPPNQPATPPAAPSAQMSATMPAADAPPSPPSPAPRAAVQKVTLAAPDLAPVADPGAAPAVPAAPPAAPVIEGADIQGFTTPTPPPVPPPAKPAPPAPFVPGAPLAVPFLADSAELPPEERSELQKFAAARGAADIAVTGFGDAASTEPAAQAAALPLAWERARAISGVLQALGVPTTSLRVDAEANGSGGVARLTK